MRAARPSTRTRRTLRSRRRSHVRSNRAAWDRDSDRYDRRYEKVLAAHGGRAWGLWRIPESRLQLLGPVRGRRILEVGCGAGRWSRGLLRVGGRPVGVDLSFAQLRKARGSVRTRRFPLARGNAESLPFADGSFDIAFCDWGALTFADPHRAIPECARVLKAGGRLVFSAASPVRGATFDRRTDRQTERLTRPYFGLRRLEFGEEVEFQLPYGEWIDLFARHRLQVERLIETRPGPRARSAYLSRDDERWGRSWPLECIWQLRRV